MSSTPDRWDKQLMHAADLSVAGKIRIRVRSNKLHLRCQTFSHIIDHIAVSYAVCAAYLL